jgi:phage-related protein
LFYIDPVATATQARPALISWEGDTKQVIGSWPEDIRKDFGYSLYEMQQGRAAILPVRPMPSIAAGVFELKDADERSWYRLVYLTRVGDTIYILHCFKKNTAKTERRDLATAEQRWKIVQQRLREEKKHEKVTGKSGKATPDARKHS